MLHGEFQPDTCIDGGTRRSLDGKLHGIVVEVGEFNSSFRPTACHVDCVFHGLTVAAIHLQRVAVGIGGPVVYHGLGDAVAQRQFYGMAVFDRSGRLHVVGAGLQPIVGIGGGDDGSDALVAHGLAVVAVGHTGLLIECHVGLKIFHALIVVTVIGGGTFGTGLDGAEVELARLEGNLHPAHTLRGSSRRHHGHCERSLGCERDFDRLKGDACKVGAGEVAVEPEVEQVAHVVGPAFEHKLAVARVSRPEVDLLLHGGEIRPHFAHLPFGPGVFDGVAPQRDTLQIVFHHYLVARKPEALGQRDDIEAGTLHAHVDHLAVVVLEVAGVCLGNAGSREGPVVGGDEAQRQLVVSPEGVESVFESPFGPVGQGSNQLARSGSDGHVLRRGRHRE